MPPCFQVASLALLCYTHSEPASRGSHDAGARAKQALHHGRSQATASSPSSVNIGSVKRWALSDFWWCMHSSTCLKPCKWSALLGVARYPDGRGQRSLRFVFLTASCSHLAASLSLQKPGTSVSLLWAIQSEASSNVSPIITALINAVAPPARWRPAMQCVTMTSPQYRDCRTSGHSSFQASARSAATATGNRLSSALGSTTPFRAYVCWLPLGALPATIDPLNSSAGSWSGPERTSP